jgi:hypothetical protein
VFQEVRRGAAGTAIGSGGGQPGRRTPPVPKHTALPRVTSQTALRRPRAGAAQYLLRKALTSGPANWAPYPALTTRQPTATFIAGSKAMSQLFG